MEHATERGGHEHATEKREAHEHMRACTMYMYYCILNYNNKKESGRI